MSVSGNGAGYRLGHALGMFDREPPGHAGPAIVTDHGEPIEAERAHHLDLVEGHRALRVAGVVFAIRRLAAVAVAS